MAAPFSGMGKQTPHKPPMSTLTPKQEQIAERAYHLYVEGGCQHGRDLEYWFQAEKELGSHFFSPPAVEKPSAPAPKAPKKAAVKKPEAAPAPAKRAAAKKANEAPAKKAVKKKA